MTAFVETPVGRFAYLAAGPPSGRLVLCLHGFPDTPESFEPLLGVLAAAGYRAVAPWTRGYAPSVASGPYHADQLADDALAIARALAGDAPFALVGHDWGAMATWVACSRSPRDLACAVALAVPHPLAFLRYLARSPGQLRRSWYMFLFQIGGAADRLVAAGDFALVDRLWRAWSPDFELGDEARRRLHACLAASMPAPVAYYRAVLWPPRAAARRVREAAAPERRPTTPILYLHGEKDGCVAAEAAAGQSGFIDGPFEQEVLPGVGHFLQLEAPAAVGDRVRRWLIAHAPPISTRAV